MELSSKPTCPRACTREETRPQVEMGSQEEKPAREEGQCSDNETTFLWEGRARPKHPKETF